MEEAENSFERAVRCRPDDPYLWNKLGAVQSKLGRAS